MRSTIANPTVRLLVMMCWLLWLYTGATSLMELTTQEDFRQTGLLGCSTVSHSKGFGMSDFLSQQIVSFFILSEQQARVGGVAKRMDE